MTAIIAFIGRILAVLPLTLTSIIGIIQAVIKFLKEVINLIINLFFPFFPDGGKFEQAIIKVRDFINKISDWFEIIKSWLLKITGLVK